MVGATVGTQTFLALDEPFLPNPTRTAPRVWIEHVRIFAAPDQELRRLKLTPGLNVIWAPDASPEERVGTRIGHGAGKTLLCRLLRHVLGEPDLASPGDAEALRHTFPEGFVEAEVHVAGVRWAVRRPFDAKAESVAVRDAELAALDGAAVEAELGYDGFLDALRATLGPSAETLAIDAWLAALGWMSRDQERRFGGSLRWRDRAAGPNSKVARVANVERVRAIRSFLRLRAAEDVAAESAVAELEVDERTTIRQLADCEREVTWLSIRLAREGVGDVSELCGQPLVLRAAISELTATLEALDGPREEPEALSAARDAYEAARCEEAVQQAMVGELDALVASLRAHEEGEHGSCGRCFTAFSFEPGPRSPTQRAARELAKQQRSLEKAARKSARARRALTKAIERDRAALRDDRRAWADARDKVARARELERQVQRRDELSARLARVQTDLADARAHRDRTIREHGKQVGRVSDVFDFVIRRLAGQDVSGRVSIGATELEAGIRLADGRPGTSPALRVLETLALDLSALILACEDRADLPGLLIHDSPREADLARSHYDALYRLAMWLEDATSAPGFQYIVTTTTSPPKSLAFRAVRLGAVANDDLLLRTPLSR